MTIATYDFSVHYDGEGLEKNSIPIRDLAPSLLALSASFQEIQSIVNPNESEISLEIKATEKGSFTAVLNLVTGTFQGAVDLLASDPSTAILNLMTYASTFYGAVKFIQKIKNSKVTKKDESSDSGNVKVTFEDGTSLEVPSNSIKASKSLEFRKSINDFVKPLDSKGIDAIDIYHEKETQITISEKEVSAFEIPPVEEEELKVSSTEQYVQIINVAFEHGKWKLSSGDNSFFAEIEDEIFLKSVEKNQEQFGSTDILKVDLETRQYVDKSGALREQFTVKKVLEHKRGSQQIKLDI